VKLRSPGVLREIIAQHGMTQAELGRTVGRSRSFISALCQGTRQSASDEVAILIAAALTVPVEVLFMSTESRPTVRNVLIASSSSAVA